MKTGIKKLNLGEEFCTPEHCFITEVANDADDPDVSIARARVAPGVTTAWHSLNGTDERYLIITGHGRVDLGDQPPADVGPGNVVRIPAGTRQRITNTGTTDLIFYAICSPRFTPECYIDLEKD